MKLYKILTALAIMLGSSLSLSAQSNVQLTYNDLTGSYINYSFTAGGASGYAVTTISRLKVKNNGAGKIDFISSSIYSGPLGTPSQVVSTTAGAPKLNFQMTITNPKQGGGTRVTYDFPVAGAELFTDFIASVGPNGVSEFYENVTGVTGYQNVGAALILNKRQF